MSEDVVAGRSWGMWLMVAASAAGLADAIFDYFWPGNGIHRSWGALLVVALSVLILLASLLIALVLRHRPRWLRILLTVLLFPGIVGCGFAAWLLEAYVLIGFMALTLLGWFARLLPGPGHREPRWVPQTPSKVR